MNSLHRCWFCSEDFNVKRHDVPWAFSFKKRSVHSSQLAAEYGRCRLLTHFIVDIHVRNPDIPQMDFHELLIVLKTVPDQALPQKKGILSRHCLSSKPSSFMKERWVVFVVAVHPPPPSPLHLSGRPILCPNERRALSAEAPPGRADRGRC